GPRVLPAQRDAGGAAGVAHDRDPPLAGALVDPVADGVIGHVAHAGVHLEAAHAPLVIGLLRMLEPALAAWIDGDERDHAPLVPLGDLGVELVLIEDVDRG